MTNDDDDDYSRGFPKKKSWKNSKPSACSLVLITWKNDNKNVRELREREKNAKDFEMMNAMNKFPFVFLLSARANIKSLST